MRAQLLVCVAAALEVRLGERVRFLRLGGAARIDEHDIHHVVRRVEARHARRADAHADDDERVHRDGGEQRHLHRGDEAEAVEQEIGKGDERVG